MTGDLGLLFSALKVITLGAGARLFLIGFAETEGAGFADTEDAGFADVFGYHQR